MSELTSLGHLLFEQSEKGYRHNIDSVLLANFIQFKKDNTILDVGSGDGVISIILKDKEPSLNITGIEVQESLFQLSNKNAKINKMQDINFINVNFFEFNSTQKFDIIITNPPYYPPEAGRLSNDDEKVIAKHEILFSLEKFLRKSKEFLNNKSSIYFVYPTIRFLEVFQLIYNLNFSIKRLRFIHNTCFEQAVLVLFHVTNFKYKVIDIEKPLVIYEDKVKKQYTEEVKKYLYMG